MAAYVDSEVGRLLAHLDKIGMRENTIVLFSSDHGGALGEWGAGEKCMFDDQVWRVPFIWNYPSRLPTGIVCDDLCELRDTGRTPIALAGLGDSVPDLCGGRDLFSDATPPRAAFGQIGWPELNTPLLTQSERDAYEKSMRGIPVYNSSLRLAVRTEQFRLDTSWMQDGTLLDQDDGNLFDLIRDPKEKRSLWNSATHADTKSALLDELRRHVERLELDPRLLSRARK